MKKIVFIVLLVFSALLFVGCDAEQASANKSDDKQNTEEDTNKDKTDEYKLIVNDDFGIILNELNDCYKEGEEVEVKIFFFSGVRAQVILDGEELKVTSSEAGKYETFIFTMPNHDATLQTTKNDLTKPQEKCNEHKYENGHCIYCGIEEPSSVVDKIDLLDVIRNINSDDLVAMTGFHSIISSYIFHSTNEDLLKYVLDLCLSIKYSEILTDENRDPVAMNQDKCISIQLTNNRLLNLTLTTESNVYLQFFKKVGGDFVVKYQFKAYKPEQYNALTVFCQMGMPQNHWWCETPACTKYCTGDYPIDEYMQETIVKTFIDYKSPLSNFYKNGTKFSGFIRKSFGKFNGYYAVIVDGCGLAYYDAFTDVIVDGVKFTYSDSNQMYLICVGGVLSLQEAFEKEIISHDDLVEISKRLNKSYDDKLVIDGTYYGKLCYTNPGLSSIRVDMVFEISDTKLIINDDKELKIEECEYDGHFFDNLDLALSYSLDYCQMFEYPNKGWFALLESSETRKSGYSILISKFNDIYVFKTVFNLENDTYYIHAIYKLINQVEQTNVINSLFVDKDYFGMLLYVQPNLLSTRDATSMTFQDDELIIGYNKYKLEEKIFDERFIKIDDDKLNNLFVFPSKGLIARIDDASYYCIIEGNDGIVYCLECAAINSEFYECDTLCAYLLVKTIKLDDSFMYRTVDDKCDSKNIAEASKVNLIQVDMTFEEVVEILGKPVAALGSGAIWYEWSLNDGTSLQIQFTPKGMEDVTLYVLRIERKYNFINDCVLVVVKKEYSEINKVWNLDFFGDLPIKKVNDLTYFDNPENIANQNDFQQILAIYLKEPSYQGVLDLIQELKKFDEFEYVRPNYIIYLN